MAASASPDGSGTEPSETLESEGLPESGLPAASEAAIVTSELLPAVPPISSAFCWMLLAIRLAPLAIKVLPTPVIEPTR